MGKHESHLSDRDLIMALDGELPARESRRVQEHVRACWKCRSRQSELEQAIAHFVQSQEQELRLPCSAGPRAMLRARMQQVPEQRKPLWWSTWVAAIACGLMIGFIVTRLFIAERHPSVVLAAPNPALTPGAASLALPGVVCGGSSQGNREVDATLRRRVFAEYGITNASAKAYEIDYLITPALGGADDIRNLWPHSYSDTEWNARVKDRLEDKLRDLVCQGKLDLATAQREIASNWIEAYKKYFRTDHPLSTRE